MSAPTTDRESRAVGPLGGDAPLEQLAPVRREVPPLRARRNRPPVIAATLAVLAALLAGAVAASRSPVPFVWTLTSGSLIAADQTWTAGTTPPRAVELTAGDDGAVLTAPSARLELAPATRVEFADEVGPVAQAVALRAGSLVADVEVTLSVDATVVTATGFGGAFRVDRDDTPRVATYGAAVGMSGDTAVSMTRLSEVPLGGPQTAVAPIQLDPADAWDARYAPTPLEIDAQIEELAAGLRSTYGTGTQLPAFYEDFVGVTEGLVAAMPRLSPVVEGDRFGPPAEALVAAVAVTALVQGTGRDLADVLADVEPARAAGGTWGVLLARQDLDGAFLREITDDALRARAELGADAEPVLPPATGSTSPPPTPDPTPSPTPTAPDTPAPTPPPQAPPEEPSPSPSPEPGPLEDPVGTVEDLLDPDDGLLTPNAPNVLEDTVDGLLDGVTGSTSGVLNGIGDTIGGLLGRLPGLGGSLGPLDVLRAFGAE